MADTTKKPNANPNKDFSWEEIVKKLIGEADSMAKALEPIAQIVRDKDNKEVKPPQDVAGKARWTAMALKAEYKSQMLEYGGAPDLGEEILDDTTKLRRRLVECLELAHAISQKTRDADGNLATLAEFYAKANAPKIEARIKAEEESIKKKQERIAQLRRAASGKRSRGTTATS